MPLESVTSLLTRKIGLEPSSLGANVVARAVARCMSECGVDDADAYRRRLEVSPETWESLVEEVVVPETWFFRDWEPFVFLGNYVTSQWMRIRGGFPARSAGALDGGSPARGAGALDGGASGAVFRALSVPCSTGEEPYSIAMTLLDRGLAPGMFQIDAIDISAKALEKGRRAVYGKTSFRGASDLGYRDRYFQETPDGYQLASEIRQRVRFFRANLLENPLPVEGIRYDAVFCRNLLIYFDPDARDRTIQVLRRLLAEDGLLFAGHAEAMIMMQSGFVSMDHPRAFAYRLGSSTAWNDVFKPKTSPKTTGADGKTPASRKVLPQRPGQRSPASTGRSERLPSPPAAIASARPETPTEEARRLADAGHLEEAIAMCEQIVERRQASAECFCLLGLILEASGDWTKAEQWFDKAIYLDPEHEEALVHLSLILDRRGDRGRAAAIRGRVRRLERARANETG